MNGSRPPMSDAQALEAIAGMFEPCPPPDVENGYDRCPRHPDVGWPCPTTRAAWISRRLDPLDEVHRAFNNLYEER